MSSKTRCRFDCAPGGAVRQHKTAQFQGNTGWVEFITNDGLTAADTATEPQQCYIVAALQNAIAYKLQIEVLVPTLFRKEKPLNGVVYDKWHVSRIHKERNKPLHVSEVALLLPPNQVVRSQPRLFQVSSKARLLCHERRKPKF